MEATHIILEFNKMTTRLAGFDYGKEIYTNQVKDKVDFSSPVILEFPSQIIKIASSFVQGFFELIIDEVGFDGIGEQVKVVTGSEALTKSILDNLI